MRRRISSLLSGLFLLTMLAVPGTQPARSQPPDAQPLTLPPLQILASNTSELVVQLTLPPFQTETGQTAAGPCQRINLSGWGQLSDPGQPDLPFLGNLMGLPPTEQAHLSVVETGPEVVREDFNLCPVATFEPVLDNPAAAPQTGSEQLIPDPLAYQESTFRPAEWAALGTSSVLRSQRVVQLRFQPFQYQAASRRLRYTTRLVLRVQFDSTLAPASFLDEGPYESVLQSALLNYTAARSWRAAPAQVAALAAPAAMPDPAYQLAVSKDGLYRVSYKDLQDQGVPVDTLDPRTFRLLNHGAEVAIQVRGGDDTKFVPGDDILFYGHKNDTRYTDTNVYWLTWGGALGMRVAGVDGSQNAGSDIQTAYTATIHAEQNLSYQSGYPSGPTQDRWYWGYLVASATSHTKDFTFNLPPVSSTAPPGSTAVVRGLLHGYSASPRHHTILKLNGVTIADATWQPKDDYAFTVSVPLSILINGLNTITVVCPLDGGITVDIPLINWFEVDYLQDYSAAGGTARFSGDLPGPHIYQVPGFLTNAAEVWDITQPLNPLRILSPIFESSAGGYTLTFQQDYSASHEYLAVEDTSLLSPDAISPVHSAGLLSPSNAADYILISYPAFLTALQPLADFHAANGLRVKVVDVQDIYNEFSAGIFDPNAIHDFLAYAYTNWARPAPSYVLLVGDGNYDFKNYLGFNQVNYVPPFLADADPWMGEVAADNRYVAFDPVTELPDMALGRLPVRSVGETTAVVQKILGYTQDLSGGWNNRVMVVADETDSAGNFSADSDKFAGGLLSTLTVDKIYLPPSPTTANRTTARTSILQGVNDGRLIIHYSGHSYYLWWEYGDIFGESNIPALTNSARLPFILSMTCLVGFYTQPDQSLSSFDEMLVRAPNGGAIATWSPTGQGLTHGHALLDAGYNQAVFKHGLLEFGLSTNQAKYYLYANSSSYRELIDTYILLGDPALRLPLEFKAFLPLTIR